MGGRKLRGPSDGPEMKPRAPHLLERLSADPKNIAVPDLFDVVNAFVFEKREQSERLGRAENAIEEIYCNYTPAQRAQFFAMLYDRFSESYDEHMRSTGHYPAILRCMQYALPYLAPPMLDLTAGTGEPLKYALKLMEAAQSLRAGPLENLIPKTNPADRGMEHAAYANEISQGMIEKARMKLAGRDVGFTSQNALILPSGFRGRFSTVLCSQTFHLISDDDKAGLVRSMRDALAPGGMAVVLEEDPFRITQSIYIDSLSLFLRAVVRPVKPGTLIALFETNGFTKLEDSATAPIDSEHAMRLHVFAKQR